MSVRQRPMILLLPLVWLAVVVVVAGLTWRVIDSAGRQVLTSGGPPPLTASGTPQQAGVQPGSAGPTTTGHDDRRKRSASPTPSAKPSARQSARQSEGGAPSAGTGPGVAPPPPVQTPLGPTPQAGQPPEDQPTSQPTEKPTQEPTRKPTPHPSQEPTQDPDQPATGTQVRSWQGSAGTVRVACTGTRIALQSVTPNDGWQVEVGDRGPEHVEVHFRSNGEEERETEVKAGCAGGVPRFQVAADD